MRAALQRLLTEAGFQTRVYGSTGEFLLEPLPDQPACLLLDVRLPGPSGLELQAALQRRNVEIPVIFLTGHADVASSVRAMKAGAVDFLEKPVEPDILFAAIRSARSGRSRRAPTRAGNNGANVLIAYPSAARGVQGSSRQTQQTVAHGLGIYERSVKTRRAEVMAKLGVDSIAGSSERRSNCGAFPAETARREA